MQEADYDVAYARTMDDLSYLWRGYEEKCRMNDTPKATTAGFLHMLTEEHVDHNENTGENLTFQEWLDATVCEWINVGHY